MKATHFALMLAFAASLLFTSGCASREDICSRVCKKAYKCEDEDEGYRDLSDCTDQCEEMSEATKDACQQEFRRLSKCYNRRFDCEGQHDDSCSRRRDQLSTCLNAQEN